MEYRTAVSVPAPAGAVWAVLADLRGWPDWTPTVTSVATDRDGVEEGQRADVKQPGRQTAHYTVERVEPGRMFRWGANSGGVRQFADHTVTPDGDGGCTVDLVFTMTGPLGGVLGTLGAGRIRTMVDTEANALRARFTTD